MRRFRRADDDSAGDLPAEHLVEGRGHAVRGLAEGDDVRRAQKRHRDAARHERPPLALELREHGVADVDRRHGLEKDVLGELLAAGVRKACGRDGFGGVCIRQSP